MKIFLALMMFVFSLQAKSLFSNDSQAEAGKYLMAVKDLIVAAQKTRGITFSYINGNESALLLIYNYRDDMKQAIGTMESLPMSKDPLVSLRATSISTSFVKLNSKALKMSSSDAFDAYTGNIAQALMLAQTVSRSGSDSMSDFGKEVSKIMMETILPLSEWMGELRALGSGAAAKGSADRKAQVKMQVLLGKIERLDQTLQAQMHSVVTQKPDFYSADINSRLATAQRAISKYVNFTKAKILKDKIKADPNDYFSLATDTISTIIVLFDMDNTAIQEDSKGWI